jgi:hypothetical protein
MELRELSDEQWKFIKPHQIPILILKIRVFMLMKPALCYPNEDFYRAFFLVNYNPSLK